VYGSVHIEVAIVVCVVKMILTQGKATAVVTWCTHHVTRHNTPIHNTLSTAPHLSISQKTLGTPPEDGNVMPKDVEATIYN
jgi:hypothetical protein